VVQSLLIDRPRSRQQARLLHVERVDTSLCQRDDKIEWSAVLVGVSGRWLCMRTGIGAAAMDCLDEGR
jgi:hypothetical protein